MYKTIYCMLLSVAIILVYFVSYGQIEAASCSTGYYYDSCNSTCIGCHSGFYCEDGEKQVACSAGTYRTEPLATASGDCLACAAGYYADLEGSTSCKPCPRGYTCPSASQPPQRCEAGSFTPNMGNSAGCSSCPQGFYCTIEKKIPCPAGTYNDKVNQTECTQCQPGQYASQSGSTACQACPAGSKCSVPHYDPVSCPIGTYSTEGSSGCILCPPGHECPDPTQMPSACPAGTFSQGGVVSTCTPCTTGTYTPNGQGAIICNLCPAGHSCVGHKSATQCPATHYSPAFHDSCELCPPGTTVNAHQSGCDHCPPGHKCAGGTSTAEKCPAGFIAPGNSTECSSCLPGYRTNSDQSSCIKCQAGKKCPRPGDGEYSCPDGYYTVGGAGYCTKAPSGTATQTTSSLPVSCGPGYYSGDGTSCQQCPSGRSCLLPNRPPKLCLDGEYSMTGDSFCSPCPTGHSCEDKTADPVVCSDGSFSPMGDPSCHACPPGLYCPLNTTGSTPFLCQEGYYSSAGQTECTECPAGSYCLDGSVSPVPCPDGTYSSPGSAACELCREGHYCSSKVATVALSPETICADGQISAAGQTECQPCPAGMACPTQKDFQPVTCSAGHYSAEGATSCSVCAAGQACLDPSKDPVTCPAGTYSYAGASSCTSCPPGHSCADPTESPVICPAGTYSLAGNADPACTTCEPGYTCVAGSTTATPAAGLCPLGSYCDASGTHQCAAGTYGVRAGQGTSEKGCERCPAGRYCQIGSDGICPRGYYCPESTTYDSQYPCPEGTYNDMEGAKSEADCKVCPAGFFCDQGTQDYRRFPCYPGWFCPEGTQASGSRHGPIRCPTGHYYRSYGAKNQTDCRPCPPGYTCNNIESYNCGRNFGTNSYTCPHACGAGYYQPHDAASDGDECRPCPEGYGCPSAHKNPRQYQCFPGFFCREGTACEIGASNPEYCYPTTGQSNEADRRCPAGTYTTSFHLTKREDCSICWEGYACPVSAGECDDGSQAGCPVGCEPGQPCYTASKTMELCATGHYCPGAPINQNGTNPYTLGSYTGEYAQYATQYDCPPGTYGPTQGLRSADECTTCDAGSYCLGGGTGVDATCPSGYYCPKGTKTQDEFPCPAGTYNDGTGLTTAFDCKVCPVGQYCPLGSSNPTDCPAGTYRNSTGAHDPQNAEAGDVPSCDPCPEGSYCPIGTVDPVPCPRGNYSASGKGECSVCTVGHYCPKNGTSESAMLKDHRCPAGTYCPAGTGDQPDKVEDACPIAQYCPEATPLPINCPAGSYNPYTGAGRAEDCLACPRGKFCLEGSSAITGNCSKGYYCYENSTISNPNPCPERYYLDQEGGFDISHCSYCKSGYYCPKGTGHPPACPQGYYCIRGVVLPEPCPIGTYGNSTGLRDIDSCTDCDPGKYCETLGQTAPSGDCDEGYYCLTNSHTAAPQDVSIGGLCPQGGYCPKGSSGPTSCSPGTFNTFTGGKTQEDCSPCTPGYYCAGSSNPYPTGPCLAGYYCVSNETNMASDPFQYRATPGHYSVDGSQNEIPCPAGTWTVEYTTADSCTACPAGYYCPNIGMIDRLEFVCPVGSYCPEGSVLPTGCPPGTFGSGTGFKNSSQCENVPATTYGHGDRLQAYTGHCLAGYVCTGGSLEPNPVDKSYGDECPAGHYCLAGGKEPTGCPEGTYSPDKRNYNGSLCLACTAGHYCSGHGQDSVTGECDAGYYCEPGNSYTTATSGPVCTAGNHCPQGSASPQPCLDGTFTSTTQQSTCGACPATTFCTRSSTAENCPKGRYCPAGTGIVQPKCPPGSYNSITNKDEKTDCTLCTQGQFCSGWGLEAPDGACLAGSYCQSGASDVEGAPGELGGSSGICTLGHYCVEGTIVPEKCPVGTFASIEGLQNVTGCQPCTPGFYCPSEGQSNATLKCTAGYHCAEGSNVGNPNDDDHGNVCTIGHYCPEGAANPIPCPEGTYQDETQQSTCKACPKGFYCKGTTVNPVACPPGEYCPEGTGHTRPKCPPGSYDSTGGLQNQTSCTICDGGKFCSKEGLLAPDGDCKAGIQCTNGASDENGTPGVLGGASGICPTGHYCGAATITPSPCPISTFANWTGNTNVSQCSPCPPGFYCPVEGLADPHQYPCSEGYYCTLGASSSTPTDGTTGDICPIGSYCTRASRQPTPCPPASHNPSLNASSCLNCPAGSYCPGNTSTPINCPPGHYCPENTDYSIPECPPGSFSSSESLKTQLECTPCAKGRYCSIYGLVEPNGNCSAGYYCFNGSSTAEGQVGILGGMTGVCPKGHYCPETTHTPISCPLGTINPLENQASIESCIRCTPGHYCENDGSEAVTGECWGGYYCPGGQTQKDPPSLVCPAGFKCTNGTIIPVGCPDGYYQDQEGQTDCKICPGGSYCVANSTQPITCPERMYCPEGAGYPTVCPSGTYSLTPGQDAENDCITCPKGKYCSNGNITGNCHAGHYCDLGNPTATPKNRGLSGLCSAGHYCPEGTESEIPCPSGTFSVLVGGRDLSVCGPCPKGYYCSGSSNLAQDCPRGQYCVAVSGTPINCPNGTYNPELRGTNLTACLPCPHGFYCPIEGMADYSSYPCPTGHYCPEETIAPLNCSEGTYAATQYGRNVSHCAACPTKKYCPEQTTTPLNCPAGFMCVEGSKEPTPCPPKSYCPALTDVPVSCPAGMYCVEGVSTPTVCPQDSYCPALTDVPIPCPYGYRTKLNNLNFRTTIDDSCEICPAGTYGNTTGQVECKECSAGHVCLQGATNPTPTNETVHQGYLCPKGNYCPAGSSKEIPCPAGTYMPNTGADGTTVQCINCDAGSYTSEAGLAECTKCGTSAWSNVGSTTCTCNGTNRGYQEDGSCLCLQGYVYFDSDNQRVESDSLADCSLEVYARCGEGQNHDANGNCVNVASACDSLCTSGSGTFSETFGFCQCSENAADVDTICDETCRSTQNKMAYDSNNKVLRVTASDGSVITTPSGDKILGDDDFNCPTNSSCEVHIVQVLSNGFKGVYNPSSTYLTGLFNGSSSSSTSKRNIFQIQETPSGVLQPIICLEAGSGLLWDISTSDGAYPVYGNNLLNSLENYDSGAFRDLENKMKSSYQVNTFMTIFDTPGQYVFEDNDDANKFVILKVREAGDPCPGSLTFRELSESNLVAVGIAPLSDIPLTPDWNLAGVLMLGAFALMGSVFLCFNYFRQRLWIGDRTKKRKKISVISKFLGEKIVDDQEEEVFDYEVCFRELEKHDNDVQDDLENNYLTFETKFEDLLQEVTTIKSMVERKQKSSLSVVINVRYLMDKLKPAMTDDDIQTVVKEFNKQLQDFQFQEDDKRPFDPEQSTLPDNLKKEMKKLDTDEEKQRHEIINQYHIFYSQMDHIKSQIDNLRLSSSNANDLAKQTKPLIKKFNGILSDFKRRLPYDMMQLNKTLKNRNDLSKQETKSYELKLDDSSFAVLKEFLKKRVTDMFEKYKLAREEDEDNEEDFAFESFESDEEIDEMSSDEENDEEDLKKVDANKSAEQRVTENQKKRKHHLIHQQREEFHDLQNELEMETKANREEIENAFNKMRDDAVEILFKKTTEKINEPGVSEQEKRQLTKKMQQQAYHIKQSVEALKKVQLENLNELIAAKRDKKMGMIEKKQDAERNRFLKEQKEEKHMLKRVVHEMLRDDKNLKAGVSIELLKQKEVLKRKLELRETNRVKRQKEEKDLLEKLSAEEDKIDLMVAKETKKSLNKTLVDEKAKILKTVVDNFQGSEEEKNALISENKKRISAYKKELDAKLRQQEKELKERLERRRIRNLRQLEAKFKKDEQKDIKEQERDLAALQKLMKRTNLANEDLEASRAREKLKQTKALEAKIASMAAQIAARKKQFVEEERKLETDIDQEKKLETKKINQKFELDGKQKLKEKEDELKSKLSAPDVDENRREQLLATHKLQLQDYEEKMSKIKQAQTHTMEKKLDEKLRLMKTQKRVEQNDVLMKELRLQEKEMDKHLKTSNEELDTIKIEIRAKDLQDLEKMKEQHNRQLADLKKKKEHEMESTLNDYKSNLSDEIEEKKKTLKKSHEKKMFSLTSKMEADIASANKQEKERIQTEFDETKALLLEKQDQERQRLEDDLETRLAAKRKKMKKKVEKEIKTITKENSDIVRKTEEKARLEAEKKKILDLLMDEKEVIHSIEDAINRVLYSRHQQELNALVEKQKDAQEKNGTQDQAQNLAQLQKRIHLKQKHLDEKKRLGKEFEKYSDLIAKGNAETREIEEELERFASQIRKQKEANLAKIREEKERMKKQMEKELQEAKERAEREKAEMMKRLNQQKNKLEIKKMMKQREEEIKNVVQQQKGLEKDERERLLDKHKLAMEQFEGALEQERQRQNRILKKRIDGYEKRIERAAEEKLKADIQDQYVDTQKEQFLKEKKAEERKKILSRTVRQAQATRSIMDQLDVVRGARGLRGHARVIQVHQIVKEKPYIGTVLERLKRIEGLLDLAYPPYTDLRDQGRKPEGRLTVVSPEELKVTRLITYKFGEFIIKLLRHKFGFPQPIKLAVASSMPQTFYAHNAFKNSFYYDIKDSILYIRDVRFDQIGKFIVILVHCIAHITVGELASDLKPSFIKNYYNMMQVVFEDLFNARNRVKQIKPEALKDKTKEQLVKGMVNYGMNPLDPKDLVTPLKMIPGKTEVDRYFAKQNIQARRAAKAQQGKSSGDSLNALREKQNNNTDALKQQLEQLKKEYKNNQTYFATKKKMAAKIVARMKPEQEKLAQNPDDKAQQARIAAYNKQLNEVKQQLKTYQTVNQQLITKMKNIQTKIKAAQ